MKKILGFGALAAGAVFLLSSFTKKSTDGSGSNTPGSGDGTGNTNCSDPAWIDASPENWMACQSGGGAGTGEDPGTEIDLGTKIIPTWDNIKIVVFKNPFTVTIKTQKGDPGGITITETSVFKVFAYSVTKAQYITDNWSMITPNSQFIVPAWFVAQSSNLATLQKEGKITCINVEPAWYLRQVGATGWRGNQYQAGSLNRQPVAYYLEKEYMTRPIINKANTWLSLNTGIVFNNADAIDVFGVVRSAGHPIFLISNKGILLSAGCPEKYRTSGLLGIFSN